MEHLCKETPETGKGGCWREGRRGFRAHPDVPFGVLNYVNGSIELLTEASCSRRLSTSRWAASARCGGEGSEHSEEASGPQRAPPQPPAISLRRLRRAGQAGVPTLELALGSSGGRGTPRGAGTFPPHWGRKGDAGLLGRFSHSSRPPPLAKQTAGPAGQKARACPGSHATGCGGCPRGRLQRRLPSPQAAAGPWASARPSPGLSFPFLKWGE